MIGVQMSQHNLPDIRRMDAPGLQLGADLILRPHAELNGQPVIWMPAWVISRFMDASGFSGIDDDDSFFVFDQPGVDREPFRPIGVEKDVARRGESFSFRLHLRSFNAYRSGLKNGDSSHGPMVRVSGCSQVTRAKLAFFKN